MLISSVKVPKGFLEACLNNNHHIIFCTFIFKANSWLDLVAFVLHILGKSTT